MDEKEKYVEELVDLEDDYSKWYNQVVRKAELADYAPVRGCMIIRPYGYAIWENIQGLLDRRFKETGVVNAYFPLFIPRSFLEKEAEHVEGFAPEVAWVTRGGGEELEEPLAVRPTSETIIGHSYAKWVQSYRDLPLLINQWNNVVRWEKRTALFLRTSEFLWQEGHTAHRTLEEAEERTQMMLEVYRSFAEEDAAIPVIAGRKSENEKFAGALRTYSIEALMGDGKALQAGTSHNLAHNFAKGFDIQFLDSDGQRKYCATTSWGMSTRMIGALIMVHGDKSGLMLPPRIAPYQAVIVPIWRKDKDKEVVMGALERLEKILKGKVRFKTDVSENTPGWKFNEWEMRGVPVRIEIGPRDVQNNSVVLVRRDNRAKEIVSIDALETRLPELLEEVQQAMYQRAVEFREKNTYYTEDYEEFKQIIAEKRGFVRVKWAEDSEAEKAIKEETKATLRVIPFDQPEGGVKGKCIYTGKPATCEAVFARAY
ncbi:prolyl-tRNA synthetase [Thermosporothrix hazakensis]|uniref:Proline--tRNA ligase n=1 Tax=Thermosporothrix hazakensis TaxID=644383 RepID=A0A326U9X8_THEHA|nr:proline--tRNA ligase [Thermosporothrix hazakensis]PZW32901.1 prolyl-tRNA synthetase [Thermosporothrix hazakensis]GCE48933.1 proline--tRNA ligase [Thermosporothrix hazakensis]